jgi:hypothetical protein
MYVQQCTAAAYTTGPVYTCIHVMTAYTRNTRYWLRYTAGIKYTFVQRARRVSVYLCMRDDTNTRRIIIDTIGIILRVWCFIKNRIVNHREDYKTVYDLLRWTLSEESAREPNEEFFFPSLNEKKNSPAVCAVDRCRRCCLACIIRDLYRMSIYIYIIYTYMYYVLLYCTMYLCMYILSW